MSFHTTTFDAIGCTNEITVLDGAALAAAGEIARAAVAELDASCSRFRDDSELARLNAAGTAAVSPLLLDAVDSALEMARETNGLVDPTVGGALRALGYDRDFAVVVRTGADPALDLVPATGWQSVRVDRETVTIRLRPGTELDLGATAKALAADSIARAVRAATGTPVLVSLGGDIAVAGDAPEDGWPILVAGAQTVSIREGGLATSSTTLRRWRAGRLELHHIVDPRTGASAPEVWQTVSVAAATCLEANAAATAAIILGDAAPPWLESRGLAARLVHRDGSTRQIAGWPAHELAGST